MMYLFSDTETGDLSPEAGDLLQAGFVLASPEFKELWAYEFGISQVDYRTSPGAMAVNQLDLDHLRKTGLLSPRVGRIEGILADEDVDRATTENILAQHKLREMHSKLVALKEDRVEVVMVCHNVPFDKPFLKWFTWLESLISYRTIDTIGVALTLQAAGLFRTKNVKLTTLTEHFKIEHSEAHSALADARADLHVLAKMVDLIKQLQTTRQIITSNSSI